MSNFTRWVTHGIKRRRLEVNARTASYLSVFVVVLALLAALYLMLVSQTAARGRHIEQLQVGLFQLRRENEQLALEVAREGVISRLKQRAIELGFVPAQQVEFIRLGDSR